MPKTPDGTVTVDTNGVENGQTVTVTLNNAQYTGEISDSAVLLLQPLVYKHLRTVKHIH